MSSRIAGFIAACLNGTASPSDVDDYVEAWHREPAGLELYEFLGMSDAEYGLWVSEPDALTAIILARRDGKPMLDAKHLKIGAA